MTKADIINQIASDSGLDKGTVSAVVESFMANVKNSIIEKENVYLRGFGTFLIKRRAIKVARNISKNTSIVIPAHDIPAFKPSKSFAKQVKGV
ncbi:MAG: integration host factor subunit beta [Alistipes sp.]|nr:integration host factor subunit beta [Alistipes sp.]